MFLFQTVVPQLFGWVISILLEKFEYPLKSFAGFLVLNPTWAEVVGVYFLLIRKRISEI